MSNEQTWPPIATAPKDGTEIIVGCRQAGVWLARNAWYRDGAKLRAEGNPYFSEEDTGWWGYRNSVVQEKLDDYDTPTHWLPMPTPPDEEA